MHALDAQSFFYGKKFHLGKILFFLPLCLRNCPVKILFVHKIRQTDDRYPLQFVFSPIINSLNAFLSPESFQRRHYIIEISFYLTAAFLAHFNGKCNAVQKADGFFISATLLIWVAHSSDSNKVHFRNLYELRFPARKIKFFVFSLIIKRHLFSSFFFPVSSPSEPEVPDTFPLPSDTISHCLPK